jgi:signal transduction histidine kinase
MHLPWLSPDAASLQALVRLPASAAWESVQTDPGAVLLILRGAACKLHSPTTSASFPELLRDPAILDTALSCLQDGQTPLHNWNTPALRELRHLGCRYALMARLLAEKTGVCATESAWCAGLLAPLGLYALAVLRGESSVSTEFEPAAVARRLCLRWKLPGWIGAVAGHLGLPLDLAVRLGADPAIFQIAQTAVQLVDKELEKPRLTAGLSLEEGLSSLGIAAHDSNSLRAQALASIPNKFPDSRVEIGDLIGLIRLASENLHLREDLGHLRLQAENDQLHEAIEQQRKSETERLHELKLNALAEFAAGAAHEINNPLAVISGQAQYLQGFEQEPERQRALHTIIGQTQRVHQLLHELLQFARPARPEKQVLDIPAIVREVVLASTDLALQRQVRIVCPEPDRATIIHADPRQVRLALECLLRNAIEAAPLGGWAGLRLELGAAGQATWMIEDNGGGPQPEQLEHLFDPFYSGRQAGRGRGFGLPTAWRLARENGGEVRYEFSNDGITRFIFRLPAEIPPGSNGHAANGKNGTVRLSNSTGLNSQGRLAGGPY